MIDEVHSAKKGLSPVCRYSLQKYIIKKERGAPLRQNILLTCAALTAVSIITAFLLTFSDMDSPAPTAPTEQTESNVRDIPMLPSPFSDSISSFTKDSPSYQYYLREYQGKLAVFLPEKETPEKVFDVYLSTLPSYDRGQLQLGIPISNYEELVKRIEDYIS